MAAKWLVLAMLASVLGISVAKHWVLIVAGANTYKNYFSQSTACHSYHTVLNHGVPPENIIHMNYDDVATSSQNPFKNNLVVLPNGTNVYEGCKIDYRRNDIRPSVFLKILQGDKEGVKKLTGRDGPVIDSGPDDNIFVSMVDHGAPGMFFFIYAAFHAADFNKALKDMHSKRRYKKMVVYVESCYSGSMFDGLLPENIEIYGSTCANAHEPGYSCCWDKTRKVYLSTLWGNAWAFDTDKADVRNRTLLDQYGVMKAACKTPPHQSHPQQYGDLSINNMVLGDFQGNVTSKAARDEWVLQQFHAESPRLEFAGIDLVHPPMDMVAIATLARRLVEAGDLNQKEIAQLRSELFRLMEIKRTADELFRDIAIHVSGTRDVDGILSEKQSVKNSVCYKAALNTLGTVCPGLNFGEYPFIRRNLHTIVNLCNMKPHGQVLHGIHMAAKGQNICLN